MRTFTTAFVCDTPTNLLVANINASDGDVSWNAVAGASGYECIVNTTAAAPTVAGTSVTGTTYHASGLAASTTYYAHVRTQCSGTNSSIWITKEFVTDRVCIAISSTSVVVSNITSTGAEVNWAASPRSVGYEYITDQSINTPTGAGTPITATTYTATGLTAATTYFTHIRSACSANNFSTWVTKHFVTQGGCDTPASISVLNITKNSADVSWTPVPFAANYEYIIDQTSMTPTVTGYTTTNTTISPSGLIPGTTYYVHLRVHCLGGSTSLWMLQSFVTAPNIGGGAACDTSNNLIVTNITSNSADISWSLVTNATGYEYQLNQLSASPISGTPITGTTYAATGLTPNTTYYFHLHTNCIQAGNGAFSSWIQRSFTTAPVGIDNINDNGFRLTAYPNPATGVVTLYISGYKGAASLRLIDVTGKAVREMNINGKDHIDISLQNLAAGIYWLKYADDIHAKVIPIQKK